jgi:hypothetical protein
VNSIDPTYEASLRTRVCDLESAVDAFARWVAIGALQGQADTAISELLNTVTVLRAERDAALADVTAWRGFAGSVAVAVHPGDAGAVIADHLATDDLPDLLAAVERVVGERDAAEADAEDVRVALLAALQGEA